jgi:hypothetical protein
MEITPRYVLGVAVVAALAGTLGLQAQNQVGRGQAGQGQGLAGTDSCGTPAPLADGERPQQPVFAPGAYPISLPAVSSTGVPNDLPNLYRDGVDFGQLPEGRQWGSSGSITTAPDGTIWVADRCGLTSAAGSSCDGPRASVNPIFQFDTSGKLLKNFGAGQFVGPHKMTFDPEGNLWLADGGNQVFKMDQNGRILLTLGRKGESGRGTDQFDSPTEVAVASNGDIFVSDGHNGGGTTQGNARILKFDKNGRFLKTWGKKGMGPGEFDVPHSITLDSRGRLFVADRQNSRIQIFDAEGKFIATWLQFGRPSAIYIDKRTDTMYVSDSESRDGRTNTGRNFLQPTGYGFNLGVRRGIRIGSARDGKVTSFIADPCPYPYSGISSMGEGVTADRDGNVYDAELSRRIRKFVRAR